MSKLAIALGLAMAATAANAQDAGSGQSRTGAVPGASETKPFLFDARMPGDGVRRGVSVDDRHPHAGVGAIVVSPKPDQPGRQQ